MKKILSMFLALSMLFASLAGNAMAEDTAVVSTEEVMHNIAEKYAKQGLSTDANMLWLLPDMAAYESLFPESKNVVSDEEKQICLDKIVSSVKDSNAPATLAKTIIALRSLGYDAREVYTKDSEQIDVVTRLTDLVDAKNKGVTSVYTLPYVIIALQQGDDYATNEQMEYLIDTLMASKKSWQNTMWGPDTATPVILALSPYYDSDEEIKSAIDETIPIIKDLQDETGIISNAASSGLAIAAFSSVGINPEDVIFGEKNVLDGLMTQVSEDFDGFKPMTNTFSTEQGFRGLISWQILKNNGDYRVYDFADYPYEAAYETPDTCTVSFKTSPDNTEVSIDGYEVNAEGNFLLPCGEYEYVARKAGYTTETDTFSVTKEDIDAPDGKIIEITLRKRSSSGGVSGTSKIRVTVDVMVHPEDCENSLTYKNNTSRFTKLISGTTVLDKGDTVYDATTNVLNIMGLDFVEENGYFSKIGDYAEFDHGTNSGWMFVIDGKHSNTGSKETKLSSNSTLVWYYTDDYRLERGSDEFENEGGYDMPKTPRFGLKDKNEDITYKEIIAPGKSFEDIKEHKNKEEIETLAERGILSGKDDALFDPDSTMTRAEFATTIVNALGLPEKNGIKFEDVTDTDWFSKYIESAYYYGIVRGVSSNQFNPEGTITLEEAAAMMQRAATVAGMDSDINILVAKDVIDKFEDAESVSSWAYPAVGFCIKEGILDCEDGNIMPKELVKRGQIAEMIYKMLGKAKLI